MSIANTLKSLAKKLDGAKAATGETTATITELRAVLAARRKELARVQHLPVPREELQARARALVEATGARFLSEEGAALVYGDYALGRPDFRVGNTRLPWQREERLWWPALCAGAPGMAEEILVGLIARLEYDEGLPSADRVARVAQLERELADIEQAEERFIDEAAGLGVQIAHRPEVRERRQNEQRQRELDEQAATARRARQEALEQAHARRPRLAVTSQYLAGTRADLDATQDLVDRVRR